MPTSGTFFRVAAVGGLKESGEDAQRPQRAVGHVLGQETPRGPILADLLPEFQRLLLADVPGRHIDHARHHFGQQFNHLGFGRRAFGC